MRKGSVTICSLLVMILVLSALLSLLEASRFFEIKRLAELQTEVALESVFAEYNTHLWEEYHILARDMNGVSGNLKTYGNRQMVSGLKGTNLYQFRVKQVELEGYTRLTDGDGDAFIQAAAGNMKENLLYETVKAIYNNYEGIKNIQDTSNFSFENIEKALDMLKEPDIAESRMVPLGERASGKYLLEFIQGIQEKGIVTLVVEEPDNLSDKSFGSLERVSNRIKPEEYNPHLENVDWYDRVLFQQYILRYMSCYTDEKNHSMRYEIEYLISGKSSDIENLKGIATQLLMLRTVANFLYLSTSPTKAEQAGIVALGIAGTSANALIVEAVKTAILTAWAFAESILDVRTLLTDGKIPLLKSDNSWTLDIDDITELKNSHLKAKDCSEGLSYKEYLGILIFFQQDTELAMRALDVQELTIRELYNDSSICIDNMIVELKISICYGYHPIFFSVENMIPFWDYELDTKKRFIYERKR